MLPVGSKDLLSSTLATRLSFYYGSHARFPLLCSRWQSLGGQISRGSGTNGSTWGRRQGMAAPV